MSLLLWINGQQRSFEELQEGETLSRLVETLAFRTDRIAIELNGRIVSRTQWDAAHIEDGDRLEVVHFVGGGIGA